MCMMMEALSENYGWTPNQIREIELEDLLAYLAILDGKTKRSSRQKSLPSVQSPRITRRLR